MTHTQNPSPEEAAVDGVELARDALLVRGGDHLAPAVDRLIRAVERRCRFRRTTPDNPVTSSDTADNSN